MDYFSGEPFSLPKRFDNIYLNYLKFKNIWLEINTIQIKHMKTIKYARSPKFPKEKKRPSEKTARQVLLQMGVSAKRFLESKT